MNVNMQNNISMMSAMVGIPHNTDGAKQITKESQSNTVLDNKLDYTEGAEGEGAAAEADEAGSEYIRKKPQTQNAGKAHKNQANRVGRKMVSDETVTDTKNKTGETAEAKQAENAAKTAKSAKMSSTMFDTSKQIQFSFNKTMDEAQAGQETKTRPDIQRKKFAENLKKWVEVEYKQYVKDNDPLYSRRNLREILQALGDTEVKGKKNGKKDDSTGKSEVSFSSFNKYNIDKASSTLKIFEEIQVPDDHTPFELVA